MLIGRKNLVLLSMQKRWLVFQGDTLASALLANGVQVLGRSFKYHRRRGIYAAGLEDPNSMLEITCGHGVEPALRAGQVQLVDGLAARSVTGWPSTKFDLVLRCNPICFLRS